MTLEQAFRRCQQEAECPLRGVAGCGCGGERGAFEACYREAAAMPRCDVMGGDGSIPGPVCVLPAGHAGPHYG
jgi:hypothetical protein